MPSPRAIGLRRDAAIEKLEKALPGLSVPRHFNWKQRGMEDVVILEALVEYFDALEAQKGNAEPDAIDYAQATVEALEAEARERGLFDSIEGSGAGGNIVKADLIAALEADDGAID